MDASILSAHPLSDINSAKDIFREKLSADEQVIYTKLPEEAFTEMREFFELFDERGEG